MKKKVKKTSEELYYKRLAEKCRDIWRQNSPIRKQVIKESRHETWSSKLKRHVCSNCERVFSLGDMQVDHKIAICKSGEVKSHKSFIKFFESCDISKDMLQHLCIPCHQMKTKKDVKEKNEIFMKYL